LSGAEGRRGPLAEQGPACQRK